MTLQKCCRSGAESAIPRVDQEGQAKKNFVITINKTRKMNIYIRDNTPAHTNVSNDQGRS